ncbi:hypothetical protein IDJ77_04075 [Mucilaginibacter sp. ZT4R22]|uniref:Uncharacterized protein n=1 Tax=Mucilaginibacter pankratovii TaxID=2772110 RepID=A0ABR7WKZ3_9SPHI|nr:hypothetical protein [Mucilaginibacter pankratovii]MBD1362979.1 hypothetical protein [Mucilaginibacter pankratovii]
MEPAETNPFESLEAVCADLRDLTYTPIILPQLEWYNGKFALVVQIREVGEAEDKAELEEFAKQHNLDFSMSLRVLRENADPENVVLLRQRTKS